MVDVARHAGVSVATVSKVVNGRYGVAEETAERVREIIGSMGYEASLGARSLRSHRTNVIGILVAEFEPFSTELIKGISGAIDATGYELLAYSGGSHGKAVGWERRSLSRLSGTLIDGAILVTPTVVDTNGGIPVVAIDPHTGRTGLPTVDSDSFGGAEISTRHLIGLGHRRIGFLGGRPDLESARLREAGFRSAMADAGLPVDETLVRVGGYRPELADGPARTMLTSGPATDRDLRGQRPVGHPDDAGRPVSGHENPRRPLGDRLRQRAGIGARHAAADHRRAALAADGSRGVAPAGRPDERSAT